ncbi:NADPH-dependent F420 reductase [Dactylosporangium sp. NPDC000521]|uniref:NADPH-dependent F420 reductase n=1 Tax=Dactylosporangium sp. NPDC000521 TaxID=3363975 RepID=UPI00368D2F90
MTYDQIELPDVSALRIGIIGGTGPQGRGLAYRFARAGLRVVLGSRSTERGAQAAEELNALPGVQQQAEGGDNTFACQADVVVIAVPWEGHESTVAELAPHLTGGKIVVDCVNPLGFDKQGPYSLPVAEGSAAEQAATLLPEARVCAAFHHVSAALLTDPEIAKIDLDVLVLGDDRDAALQVQAIAEKVDGMRGVFAGRLRNAGQVEALTANLIAINKRYKVHAGVRVTDL